MKQLILLLFFVTVALSITVAQPITNVVAVQKDNLVEITYNLEGDFPADISLYYCEKDGEDCKGPLISVTGDIGLAIKPGTRKIIWNVLKEQDFLVGNNITFRVKGITISGSLTDERDGKNYKTVKIGDQIWMAENLRFKSKTEKYFAYKGDEENGNIYGYMYKWKAAIVICPSGWHLPSKNDFESIFLSAETTHSLLSGGGSGFSVLFGGYRTDYGGYIGIDNETGFWTSTETQQYTALYFGINNEKSKLYLQYSDFGFYVRCIKD
jgi:uncharacterized protein (TIGR02145 family)